MFLPPSLSLSAVQLKPTILEIVADVAVFIDLEELKRTGKFLLARNNATGQQPISLRAL